MNSMKLSPKAIKVKIKASHYNDYINMNSLNYTTNAVTNGVGSWTKPFNKPQLVAHDKQSDPIGRIIDKRLCLSDSVDEPKNYIQLTATINDSSAIEKVLDGRYNTVSIGSRTTKVLCSKCDQNIIQDGLCEHKKGSLDSKGKRIYWKIDQIDYVECSFVNEPADDYAMIDQIDVGFGFVSYKDFLDNQESLLTGAINTEVIMKDKNEQTKEELIDSLVKLETSQKDLEDSKKSEIEVLNNKIKELETKLADQVTILTSREDEINKYIDLLASSEKKLKDSIISNIVDLKKSDTKEDRTSILAKLEARQVQSLVDTLEDLRIEITTTDKNVDNKDRIPDPTLTAANDTNSSKPLVDTKKDPWLIFGQDNTLVEAL